MRFSKYLRVRVRGLSSSKYKRRIDCMLARRLAITCVSLESFVHHTVCTATYTLARIALRVERYLFKNLLNV